MSYFDGDGDADGDEIDNNSDDNSSESTQIEGDDDEIEDEIEEEIEDEIEDDENDENDEDQDGDPMGGGGDNDNDLEEGDIDVESEANTKRTKKIPPKTFYKPPDDDDDDDDDDDGEMYLQKFDQSVNNNYIVDFHPESVLQNYDEILAMVRVIRDKDGIIIDDLHRTIPYLTKYERSRILGQRAKQINAGASPFVKVPENVIDGYIIAEIELKEKRIPFIIRRPLPNGGSEYWSIKDLEDISF